MQYMPRIWINGACRYSPRRWYRCGSAVNIARSFCIFLALLVITASCTVQLSPAFDQATYTRLTDLNVRTETLFSSLSKGGTATDFASYKPIYDELIGGFSAARMATETRQVPTTSQRLFGGGGLKEACGEDLTDCVNPTPHHLDKIVVLLT